MEFESKFLKVGLKGKVKQRLEQETRYQNLTDRFNGILSGMDKLGYMAKFGRMLFSDDIYEEMAIICSELGEENPLDT